MTRHLLSAFAIFLLSATANAQTNVSGNITQNTTWTKAGSPYTMTGNVGIPSAYTLTIEAGVTVQRSGDYQILVQGGLQCNGAAMDSIVMISPGTLDYNSRYFIEFQKTDLSRSAISFIVLQNNGGTNSFLRLGNETESNQSTVKNTGMLSVSHSHIDHGYVDTRGYRTTASLRIDSSIITSCHMGADNQYSEPISVFNTSLYNSYLPITGFAVKISYTNCYLNGNDMIVSCCGSILSVVNSTLENCKLNDFLGQSQDDSLSFENSNLINTPVSVNGAFLSIANSNISYTQKVYNRDGSASGTMLIAGIAVITNSNLQNSSSENIDGVFISGSTFNPAANTVLHNQFTNLYDAVTVAKFSSIQLDSNNFFAARRYDIVNTSPTDFSALYNYFQLGSAQTIDDLIYDQNDDLNYGLVTYTPYASGPTVLPVTLVSLSGAASRNTIKLSWEVSDDLNIFAFVVQKKGNNSFTDIGTVTASGISGGASYSFTDASPLSGTNEYRLNITDRDGRSTYSNIVPVKYDAIAKALRVYPNPASSYLIIEYTSAKEGTQLQLTDAVGKVIKTVTAAMGSTQIKMPVSDVARGIYKVVIKTGSATESRTVLIQ